MMKTERLKEFSTDFFPTRNDIMIAYATLNFFRNEYSGNNFSNLDCSFNNVMRLLEKRYQNQDI